MLKDKVIVITGASSGLGLELAKQLAPLQAKVIVTGRDQEKLSKAISDISGHVHSFALDVRNTQQVDEVMTAIIEQYQRIDILINNAGFGRFERIEDMSVYEYEDMINTNYLGVVRCTKAVLPIMEKQRSGHIVNIASLAGMIGNAKSTSYASTKHAVLGFTNSLRMELRERNIKVSAVNPGPIHTAFFAYADTTGKYVESVKWMLLQPEKVAHKIIKLLHSQKAELNLPWLAGLGLRLYGLCPRWIDQVAGKWLNKK